MPRFIIRVICFGYLVLIEKFSQFLVDFSQTLSVLDGTGFRVSVPITVTPIIRNDGFPRWRRAQSPHRGAFWLFQP